MTIEEAKAVIYGNVVYACEKAGFSPCTTKLVQDACDMVIAMADRKTENSSEKPNNCEPQTCENRECKNYDTINDHCMFIEQCHYEPKDEPQTSGVVWTENAIKNEPKSYTTWASTDEPQTKQQTKRPWGMYIIEHPMYE